MNRLILVILLAMDVSGQTLTGLQHNGTKSSGVLSAALTAKSYTMSFRIEGKFVSNSNYQKLFVIGNLASVYFVSNSRYIYLFNGYDGGTFPGIDISSYGDANGNFDIRVAMTRNRTGSSAGSPSLYYVDTWNGDCTGHKSTSSSSLVYGGGESVNEAGAAFYFGGGTPQGLYSDVVSLTNPFVVDFVRMSSTLNTTPSCPVDAPATIADLMDFRFEGNSTADMSPNAWNLTTSGTSFVNSLYYNPTVFLSGWQSALPVFRVGVLQNSITANTSVTFAGNGIPASYAWSQVSGPGTITFANPNAAAPGVTASTEGDYQLQATVIDSGGHNGSTTMHFGFVNTDANGVKIYSNPELGHVLGPITVHGVNPWPFYDQTEIWDANTLSPYVQHPPPGKTMFSGTGVNNATIVYGYPYSGNTLDTWKVRICGNGLPDAVQVSQNSGAYGPCRALSTVAGLPAGVTSADGTVPGATGYATTLDANGTYVVFQTTSGHTTGDMWVLGPAQGTAGLTVSTGNNVLHGTGTCWAGGCGDSTQSFAPGDAVWLIWNVSAPSDHQGRYYTTIRRGATLTDTSITLDDYTYTGPNTSQATTDIFLEKANPSIMGLGWTATAQPSLSWNYYDVVVGLYRVWQRTMLDSYRDLARTFSALWWQYGLDHGRRVTTPRNSGWQGMLAAATDGAVNISWNDLAFNISYYGYSSTPVTVGQPDVRETAYSTMATALMTDLYPAHGGSASQWCTYVKNEITNMWLVDYATTPNGDAWFQENYYVNNPSYPSAGSPAGPGPASSFGTSPWRGTGLGNIALAKSYDALNGCGQTNLAASVLNLLKSSVRFGYDYGRSPDGGLYYNIMYASNSSDPSHFMTSLYAPSATATVTNGSATVTGSSGALFLNYFPPGSSIELCAASTFGGGCVNNGIYTVLSTASNTSLTLATPFNGTSGTYAYINGGTLDVTKGSQTVVGHNTAFRQYFGDGTACPGAGPNKFLAVNSGTGLKERVVYQVVSCTDDTHLQINTPFTGTTTAGLKDWSESDATGVGVYSPASCAPSLGTQCEEDHYNGRNLSADYAVSASWLYNQTGDATWRNIAQWFIGKVMGGAIAGPATNLSNAANCTSSTCAGTVSGAAGAYADGLTGNFASLLPACGVSPCVAAGSVGLTQGGKPFGMAAGAGSIQSAVAWLMPYNCLNDITISGTESIPASGGSGVLTITALDPSCTWTASSSGDWLTITGGSTGTGSGSIYWSAGPNHVFTTRLATIGIGNGPAWSAMESPLAGMTLGGTAVFGGIRIH